jgi:hypothetical protein
MFHRKVFSGQITRANTADELRESCMGDFATDAFRRVRALPVSEQPAFPCVVDPEQGRTLYVPGLDPQELREAPFSNVYARREAKTVLLVPWEMGPINPRRSDRDPIYVFSPGRCGSTLLHKILVAARIGSVSEPDVGSALISRAYWKSRIKRPLVRWATRIYVRDLVNALGDDNGALVVKLRSQFCAAVHHLLAGARERRTIFMTRRFETWAQSVGQNFKVTPEFLVWEYRQSLACYAYLVQRTDCHLLRYEELQEEPHKHLATLAEFLGREISKEVIDQALSVNSQTGTSLENVSERRRTRWDAMRDATYERWKASGTPELHDEIFGSWRTDNG